MKVKKREKILPQIKFCEIKDFKKSCVVREKFKKIEKLKMI